MNRRIRINPIPAGYYGHTVDIPNMPDFPGIWIVSAERFDFWLGIMEQDLARWVEFDGEPDEIAAWKRQVAVLKDAAETELPEAEPAKRAAALEQRRIQDERMADWFAAQ